MNEQEARQVLRTLRQLSHQRREDAPGLSEALLLRTEDDLSEIVRAEEALSLLSVLAIEPTRDDLEATLFELRSFVEGAQNIGDVAFVDERTDRQINLGDPDVLPASPKGSPFGEMRRFVEQLVPQPHDEFRRGPKSDGSDA